MSKKDSSTPAFSRDREFGVILEDINSKFGVVIDEVRSLKDKTHVLTQELGRQKETIFLIQADGRVIKKDIAMIKEDVSLLKADMTIVKNDIVLLKEDTSLLKADMTIVKSVTADIKTSLCSNDKRLTRLESACAK